MLRKQEMSETDRYVVWNEYDITKERILNDKPIKLIIEIIKELFNNEK